mgnify:CR=1 FL=1
MSKYTLVFVMFEMAMAVLKPGQPSRVVASPEKPPIVMPADRD